METKGTYSKAAAQAAPEKNLAEKRITSGAVSATIWQNELKLKTGESAVFKTITLQRSYKDKDNKWQHTSSMRLNDLPKAALVLNKAYEYLVIREQNSFSSEEAAETDIEEEIVI